MNEESIWDTLHDRFLIEFSVPHTSQHLRHIRSALVDCAEVDQAFARYLAASLKAALLDYKFKGN